MHIHEQGATANDLEQLAGSSTGAGVTPPSPQTPPGTATLGERGEMPLATTMHQTDDGSPRYEPPGRDRGGLHGRNDSQAR